MRHFRRRRRAAAATLGPYFEDRLEVDFIGTFEDQNPRHGGAEELYNLALDTHVGAECRKLIDQTMPLIKALMIEYRVSGKQMRGVADALMLMFTIWYYG